jgi:putative phosphoribosyl transferase
MALYRDRIDAGQKLLRALPDFPDETPIVLALPRGGVPIGAVIAEALGSPLDLILVRKVGAPQNPELALGAVTGPGGLVLNDAICRALNLTEDDVRQMAETQIQEIERRRVTYLGERARVPVAGKAVIVVDDGVATGATAMAALRALQAERPARVILAVPVAGADVLERLRPQADLIVCPAPFLPHGAVGGAYDHFPQVPDSGVTALLRAHSETGSPPAPP